MSSRRRSRRRRRSSIFRSRNSPKLFDYFVVVGVHQTNFNAPTNKQFLPNAKDTGWSPTVQYSYNSNKIISATTTQSTTTTTSSTSSSPIPKLQERYSQLHVDKQSAKEELELMEQIRKFSFCDLTDLVNKYNALSNKDKEARKYYKILSFKHALQSEKFTFCVTKSTGQRLYGHCRRLFTPDVNLKPAQMPTALVLISPHRFHLLFEQIMDHIVARWLICHQAIFPILDALILNQPPALGDTFRVVIKSQVSKDDEVLTFKLNSTYHVELKTLFQTLSVDNILWLISCVLTERRIIFYCNSLETLSSCIHALLALIYPFRWQHIFVPVLPESLINYLAAPMPFIIGIKAYLAHSKTEFEISEVVLVDLDKQSVRSTNELQDKLRALPSDPSWKLKRELKKLLKKHSLALQTPDDYRHKYSNYNPKSLNIPKFQTNIQQAAKGWDDLAFYDAFLAFFVLFIGDWKNFYDETNKNVPKPPYHLSSEIAIVQDNINNASSDSTNSLKQSVTATSHTPPAIMVEVNGQTETHKPPQQEENKENNKFKIKNKFKKLKKVGGAVGGMAVMASDKLKKKLRDEAKRREVTKDKKMYYNGEALEYIELLCQSQLFQTWFVRQQKESMNSVDKVRGIQDRYDYVMANFNRIGASYTGCYKYLCQDSKYRNANNNIHGNLRQIIELTASFTSNRDYTALMQQQQSIQLTLGKLGEEASRPMGFAAIMNIIILRLNDCYGKNNHPHGLMALYLLANLIENSSDRILIQAMNKFVFYANVLTKYQHEKMLIAKQMNKIALEVVKISTRLEEIKKLKIDKYVAFGDDYEYKYDENKSKLIDNNGDSDSGKNAAFIDDKIAEIDFANIAHNKSDQSLLGNFLHSNQNNASSKIFTEISQFRVDSVGEYRERCLRGEVRMIPPFEHLRNEFGERMPRDLFNDGVDDILALFSDDDQVSGSGSEKASEFAMNILNSCGAVSQGVPDVPKLEHEQLSIFDLGSNDIDTHMASSGGLMDNNNNNNNNTSTEQKDKDDYDSETKRDHTRYSVRDFNKDWVNFDNDNDDDDDDDDNDVHMLEHCDPFKQFDTSTNTNNENNNNYVKKQQNTLDDILFSGVKVKKKKKRSSKLFRVLNKVTNMNRNSNKEDSGELFGIDNVLPININNTNKSKDFDALNFNSNKRHNNIHKADKNNSKAASLFDGFDFTQDDDKVVNRKQTQKTKHTNTDTFGDLFGDFSTNQNGTKVNNVNNEAAVLVEKKSVKALMQNAYNNKSHNQSQAKQSNKANDLFSDLFD